MVKIFYNHAHLQGPKDIKTGLDLSHTNLNCAMISPKSATDVLIPYQNIICFMLGTKFI